MHEQITPLVELPLLDPEDCEEGEPHPTIAKAASNLARAWPAGRAFFLELGLVPADADLGAGRQPLAYVLERLRAEDMHPIPVSAPGREAAFQGAVGEAVAEDGNGVCLRLGADSFADVDAAVAECLELLAGWSLEPEQADLILDFAAIAGEPNGPTILAAEALVASLPKVERWRTLTIAASAFPAVSEFGPDSFNLAPRAEWSIWRALLARELPRLPAFADYNITGVQGAYDVAAAYYRPAPNLRYSAAEEFLIWKAKHPKHGHDQFNEICRLAVARPEYTGEDFSPGDGYIARCAAGEDGPGMAVQWLRTGISHHLATVAAQVSNLP